MSELIIGDKFKLTEPLHTLCCPFIFQVGDIVRIFKVHSKKRLLVVNVGTKSIHKVKRSSLNRCGELINGGGVCYEC